MTEQPKPPLSSNDVESLGAGPHDARKPRF
jgi:hypothetical protein